MTRPKFTTKISIKHPDGLIREVDIPEELPPNRKGEISPDTKEELHQLDLDICCYPLPKEYKKGE